MTPREIIKGNLDRSGPERVGMHFDRGRMDDLCGASHTTSALWQERRWVEGNVEYTDDVWGNVWHRLVHMSRGGEICKPAIDDWSKLDSYELPPLDRPDLYEEARAVFSAEKKRFRTGWLLGFPFAICRYLRKMENYFVDLLAERHRIDVLHDRVTSLLERVIRRYGEAGADAIFFCEDWGTQERLLVSPGMWREIFAPLYERLCAAAKEAGLYVLMHSCGYNAAILDDLAAVGVSCFQFDQPELYGLEELGERLRKLRMCLWAPVDIQRIMPTGDRRLIESAARRMIGLFGRPEGGLIAKNYGDLPGIGVEESWDDWAYEIFRAEGRVRT
jgi:uroporphyrinogen decarboxylase